MNGGSAIYEATRADMSRKCIRLMWSRRGLPQVRRAIKAHARVIRLHRSHAGHFAAHNMAAVSREAGIRATGKPV